MAVRRAGLRPTWHETYPAATELDCSGFQGPHDPPLLVDVGGNHAHDVVSFKSRNPQIKGRWIVQDLPETLARVSNVPGDIELVPYDFFTAQPIQGMQLIPATRPSYAVGLANLQSRRARISFQIGMPRLYR